MKANTRLRTSASVYSIYIVLALVNLATVAFVLGWSYHTSTAYNVALHENRRAAEQLAGFQDLRTTAMRVSAATVGVFVSHDPKLQKRQLADAIGQFDAALARCRKAQHAAHAPDSRAIFVDHFYMQGAMGEMVEASETILGLVGDPAGDRAGDPAGDNDAAAAASLPRMNAAFGRLMTRIETSANRVRSEQRAAFARQTAAYDTMVRNGAILSFVVALFVIAVTAHGFRVVRELGSARERERYIDALQVAIAERDAQQKTLRAREELLIEAEQLATMGNFNWDIVHDSLYWSDELCRILGVPPGTEANLERYLGRVHHDDRDQVVAAVEQAIATGGRVSFEHRWVRPAGDICVIRVKGKVETDAEGRSARMTGVVQDITEQQATIAKLRRHEIQLAEAQKIAHIGSWAWDGSTSEGVWSEEIFRISGADPTTTPSFESYVALIHPEDRQRFLDEHAAVAAEQREDISLDHRILRPDGGIIHVSLHSQFRYGAQGEVLSAVGTVQDITERKRIEESLRISEERFALAAKATNEVIWDWNAVTGKLWCNDTFWSRYGYPEPASGVYGAEAWLDNLHPDDREPVWQSFQHAIAGGAQHYSTEYRVQTSSGEWLDVFDCGYLLRDDAGNVVRVIGASQDITDRKRATEELARMHQQNELVLNSTVDAIFGADPDGRINLVNAAGTRMFGWSAEEMVGQSAHDLLHHSHPDGSPYPANECPARLNVSQGTAQRNTDVFWRKDGTPVPVEWTLSPIFADDGTARGAVMTCMDITERVKIDRMKVEFVSTVSHELRTPLTAIRGALGLLSTGRMGVFPTKAQRLLDIASTNTDRLVRLINDILDIERLDSGKLMLSRRPTAVDGLIEQAVEGVRPLLDRARIATIVESTPDVISIDPDRIMQTLTNLLSNAIKFSPDGSTILVTAERNGAEMRFSVTDEGRGIPSDKLEKIFERFEQVDATDSRDKGGSGLGLSICRSIVRQHGGTIHAESEPGRGSTFTFSIPAPLAEASRSAATRRKVLVCENAQQAGVATMRTLLDQNGFEVRAVAQGEDLLEAVRNDVPDVVLLDLCAPETNGFEVLARMRNHPDTADVPVVIVSALAPEDIRARDGVCAWLPKPLTPETLVAALKCACDPNPKRKPRLLVVEDDPDLARVIAALFERYAVEVTLASTGREAIEFAREIRPDLLVLDLVLPDFDGFAVVHSLRTDDCCRNVPLLVYSAFEPSATQQEHLRLGPTEFLTKSRVSPEQLEQRVAALVNTIIRERGDLFDAA